MSTSSARARRALRRNAVQTAQREEVRARAVGYIRVSDAITEVVGDGTFDLATGDFAMANAGSIASLRQAYGGGIAFT